MQPLFITFTGVDEHTDLRGMIALSAQYPIEWGVLFSPKRQGCETRYPPFHHIEWVLENAPSQDQCDEFGHFGLPAQITTTREAYHG